MILYNKARLYDIKPNDLEKVLEWRNEESIRNVMFNSEIITNEQHTKWFHRISKSPYDISKIFYYDEVPYGVLNITRIDKVNETCEWGFYIGNQSSPKGMGAILGYTALNYIFEELLIRKLSAQVLNNNKKSINFHEKLGFTKEGILRQQIIKEQIHYDVILYGYLKSEWEKRSQILRESIERDYV